MRSLLLFAAFLLACDATVEVECVGHTFETCPMECVFDDPAEECRVSCADEPCPDGFRCESVSTNDCADERDVVCETYVGAEDACVPDD